MAASLSNADVARIAQDFARIQAAHPSAEEQLLVRYALMWLCVAERPLRAAELWIALQVQEAKSLDEVEKLVVEKAYFDESKAASSLQSLMGPVIKISESSAAGAEKPGEKQLYVALADPQIRDFVFYGTDAVPEMFATDAESAHIVITSVCIVICSVTGLHLVHLHDTDSATGLVLYAWTHWNRHFQMSRTTFDTDSLKSLMDGSTYRVAIDALVFLLKLKDLLTGPIERSSGTDDGIEMVRKVKRAQQALERPLELLTALVKLRCVDALQSARRNYENGAQNLDTSSDGEPLLVGLLDKPRGSTSKLLSMQLDTTLFFQAASVLGKVEKQVVQAFADVARELRCVAACFVHARLDIEYNEQFGPDGGSPLDFLFHTADFMEAVAGYPFWNVLTKKTSAQYFEIEDPTDEFFVEAPIVLERVRLDDSITRPSSVKTTRSAPELQMAPADKFKSAVAGLANSYGTRPTRPGGPFTINGLRTLSQRTTSFGVLTDTMHSTSTDSFMTVNWFVPASLKTFLRHKVLPFWNSASQTTMFKSVDEFLSGAFTGGVTTTWPAAKAAIMANGYGAAAALVVTALALYLVRRMIAPWVGSHLIYGHPVADMTLAFTDPAALLAKHLAPSWLWIGFMWGQKFALDVVAILALGYIAGGEGRLPENVLEPIRAHPNLVKWFTWALEASKVLWLCWTFISAEYMFTRGAETVAVLVAYWRLFFGGDEDHLVMTRLLKERWDKVPLHWYLVLHYAKVAIWPVLYLSVLTGLLGQPGMLLVVAGLAAAVTAMVKWPEQVGSTARYGSALLLLGFALLVAVLLGLEFVDDPLGLKASTRELRREGNAARLAVPGNAMARLGILSGHGVCPLELPTNAQPELSDVGEGAAEEVLPAATAGVEEPSADSAGLEAAKKFD